MLKGDIRVSYRKSMGEWLATAVPFDIIGIGETKPKALKQMKELVEDYFSEVVGEILAGNKVQFFNPSEASEWNRKDSVLFVVRIEVQVPRPRSPGPVPEPDSPAEIYELAELRKFIDSLDALASIELVPA